MSAPRCSTWLLLAGLLLAAGCGSGARPEPLLSEETFHWLCQPIAFSPPPERWYREGDNGGGKLGVRFVLRNGGGQCISIAGHRWLDGDVQVDGRTRADQPTLHELLPRLRLQPDRMQNPEYWRLGRARDTVLAGLPAYASDDTLVLPEQTLLYHQVYWVVNGSAFEAIFQGREENLETFHRVVDSIRFPLDGVH